MPLAFVSGLFFYFLVLLVLLNFAGKLGFWLPLAKLSCLSQVSNWVCGFFFLKWSNINSVDWVLSLMGFFFVVMLRIEVPLGVGSILGF